MTTFPAIAALGFFLGMRHATDPDHVIAVTTIVARQKSASSATLIGALWGIGHTVTILIVGGGIIMFQWVIPARMGLAMEFSVGLMLILLGLMSLTDMRRLVRERRDIAHDSHATLHSHTHAHGDYIHTHVHGHEPEEHPHSPERTPVGWVDGHFGALSAYQFVRPLVVGIVHGLAGSAAVALLVLTTIQDPRWSTIYLLIFGLGTILGMMVITVAIAVPFAYTGLHSSRLNLGLRLVSGILSLGFGLFLAYQIGIVHGLFTGQPRWTPQ